VGGPTFGDVRKIKCRVGGRGRWVDPLLAMSAKSSLGLEVGAGGWTHFWLCPENQVSGER